MKYSILLLALGLAFTSGTSGCSKDKHAVVKQRLSEQILDEVPPIQNKLDVEIDGKMELLGYKIEPSGPLKVGQRMKITLYWRPKEKLESGYILFTHILDGSGERVWNLDNNGKLRKGKKYRPAYPPSAWQVGKVYVDEMSVKVPEKVKTDKLTIVAGVGKGRTLNAEDRLPITRGKKDSANRTPIATLAVIQEERKPKSRGMPSITVEKLDPTVKLKIDGKLTEEAWQKAPVLGPFVDVKTGEPNKTFPVNGSARMLWNDEALFVAFEVKDADVVGGFKKGEKDPHLWTKDSVELIIDPGAAGDNQDYYEIQINPQNLVFDTRFDKYREPMTEPDGPFGHQDWTANVKSAVVVEGTLDQSDDQDTGYVVEAMLPWKSFDKAKTVPPALGDVWRMNLYAIQANDGVAWSPILGKGSFHKASRFGRVRFGNKPAAPPGSASGAPAASGLPTLSGSARAVTPGDAKVPGAKPLGSAR